jgi:AcrR family transcriptional regulator
LHFCNRCIISVGRRLTAVQEGLRQRKKRRTRRALVDAALKLFAEHGYDQTTIAAITAAADIAPRTFFSYFRSKDDLLFANFDDALELMRAGFAAQPAGEGPAEALQRIATHVLPQAADHLLGEHADIRRRLLLSRPELAARAVQCMQEAERELATQLHAAFPDHLSELQAVAVTAALVAVALRSIEDGTPPDRMHANLAWALDLVKPVMASRSQPPGPHA